MKKTVMLTLATLVLIGTISIGLLADTSAGNPAAPDTRPAAEPDVTPLACRLVDIADVRKLAEESSDVDFKSIVEGGKLPASGLFAVDVVPDGPAGKAGLKMGDIITAVFGSATPNMASWEKLNAKPFKIGQRCQIDYLRLNESGVWQRRTVITVADLKEKFVKADPKSKIAGGPAAEIDDQRYDPERNFSDRKAAIVNNCPYVELSGFSFGNPSDLNGGFKQDLQWKNVGKRPIVAFEIVILEYDAFNRRLVGTRWTVTGHNSVNWKPLGPGESGHDGTIGQSDGEDFTEIAYVRLARLEDGTIWRADDAKLSDELRKAAPEIQEPGDVKPDKPPKAR